jgi:hypothetical protein
LDGRAAVTSTPRYLSSLEARKKMLPYNPWGPATFRRLITGQVKKCFAFITAHTILLLSRFAIGANSKTKTFSDCHCIVGKMIISIEKKTKTLNPRSLNEVQLNKITSAANSKKKSISDCHCIVGKKIISIF